MLLSYSHRFLFFHVPKTAGVSVAERFEPYAHRPERLAMNRLLERVGIRVNLLLGPHRWKRFRCHTTAATVRYALPPDLFGSLFKFAFVRNPWDWLVSRYHYILQAQHHGQRRRVIRLDGFADYVRWQGSRRRRGQVEMLVDGRGELLVDYVGRYETLKYDYALIAQRIGISTRPLGQLNTSKRGDYRDYYDRRTREYVLDRWRRDIEELCYEFDGPERTVLPAA
ncbi:MAG: sulfotransferase family 2 domain-containing protein [Planctomycetota bacterium]